ncbi:MAG: DUF427 domain-containing protein [Acidimicrobiales bacterium]
MALTLGSIAPLGRPTGGQLNFPIPDTPAHLLYLHDLPSRLRGEAGGETIVDTTAGRLLHETRLLPRWYFPRPDVRTDLLEPSQTVTHCPFKGDARYWHLRIGEHLVEDAFWEYPEPWEGAPALAGLLSPYTEKFDRWLEEDEELVGHPRDPFHRVDVRRSSRRVEVLAGTEVIATSSRAVAVNETGLPTRWYLPADDVTSGVLQSSDTTTVCPYKGVARYWSVDIGGRRLDDAAWAYEEPFDEVAAARGMVSFLADGITVEVG